MASEHPFQFLFESFGRFPAAHSESVNRKAYEALLEALSVPVESPGRCILLRAPRAGHGKTHLLSRLQHELAGSHEFIPLQPASGSRITPASVTEDALRRLTRSLPAAGGLTALDLIVRRLFSSALQPLVRSGEVPCQDREGALNALRTRPVETFDFHHPNAVTAHWARENFEVLGPRLSIELAQQSGLPVREVTFWVEVLFRFAATAPDHPARAGALSQSVFGTAASEGVSLERLAALLALVTQLQRVVLVADELEGFSADETAALKLAAFIGSLRQSVERLEVIVSLNQDVWESAFVPRLSGGLADRLSEVLVELEPLTEEEMVALLESRAAGLGKQVLEHVHTEERHARGLLRAAAAAWIEASRQHSNEAVAEPELTKAGEPAAAVEPAVVAAVPEEEPEVVEAVEPFRFEPPPAPSFNLPADEPAVEVPASWPSPEPVEEPAFRFSAPDPAPEASPSPFVAVPETPPSPPIFEPVAEPHAESAPPATAETQPAGSSDRVEDLLRQFRERYGRGSL